MKQQPQEILTENASFWIQNPKWLGRPGLIHGMLARQGTAYEGKLPLDQTMLAAGPYLRELFDQGVHFALDESLDEGMAREIAANLANPSGVRLVGADQVHGDHLEVIGTAEDLIRAHAHALVNGMPLYEFPGTDGLITTLANHVLIIQTADCLPIFFCDRPSGILGACHCGWRGLLAGLAIKTARGMIELGARAESLEAWIAPGIRCDSYEVGRELVEKFQAEYPGAHVSPNGTHLDLAHVAISQLRGIGLRDDHLTDSDQCTFSNPELYHSYRREGARAGRLISVIARLI